MDDKKPGESRVFSIQSLLWFAAMVLLFYAVGLRNSPAARAAWVLFSLQFSWLAIRTWVRTRLPYLFLSYVAVAIMSIYLGVCEFTGIDAYSRTMAYGAPVLVLFGIGCGAGFVESKAHPLAWAEFRKLSAARTSPLSWVLGDNIPDLRNKS